MVGAGALGVLGDGGIVPPFPLHAAIPKARAAASDPMRTTRIIAILR